MTCTALGIFSQAHSYLLATLSGLGHLSLGGSRCLRTSSLVAMALYWRADFTSAGNLILALCSYVWTRMLLLEAG